MKSFHLAVPSMKWFWFFFHHWWRQFSSTLLRRNKFPKISVDDFHFDWLQINSIGFYWFFSNRNDTLGFLFNETDFQINLVQKLFSKKFHFTDFNFMEFKSIKTAFFVIPIWKWISSAFPLMELVLTIFPWNKSVCVVSLCTKLNFVACSWMETSFLDFREWN